MGTFLKSFDIPFKEVILATTQHRILDFDTNIPAHLALHKKLSRAAGAAAAKARAVGLLSVRANEAGNHMEGFVKAALREALPLSATKPSSAVSTSKCKHFFRSPSSNRRSVAESSTSRILNINSSSDRWDSIGCEELLRDHYDPAYRRSTILRASPTRASPI